MFKSSSSIFTHAINVLVFASLCVASASSQSSAQGIGPYFGGVFPQASPDAPKKWIVEDAFPSLSFIDPLWLTEIPGTQQFLIVTKSGQFFRFSKAKTTTQQQVTRVLDISSRVQLSEDQGAYSLAFHPQFGVANSPNTNSVFICYSYKPISGSNTPDRSMWRVSKFQWIQSSGTIDSTSEQVLIQQYDPHRWHNGGALHFDKHGFLLIVCGDGGGADNEFSKSQKINQEFFGGVLRIDVNNDPHKSKPIEKQPSNLNIPPLFPNNHTAGYSIPKDNPWVGLNHGGSLVLEEYYAFGLRSPHGAHYDSESDDMWIGDVGQILREELNRVTKGGNYQWPVREGLELNPWRNASLLDVGTSTPPAYSYGRALGGCIIGGPMYRGTKWSSELGGKVLFGDNLRGTISTYTPDGQVEQLIGYMGGTFYNGLSNFATDSEGDVFLLKLNGQNREGGKILKLEKEGNLVEPPQFLSQTGLFSDIASLTPSRHLVSYDVGSPLWSDGADKKRWFVLPSSGPQLEIQSKITTNVSGNWKFPAGSLLVKHFEIATNINEPNSIKRLETRIFVIAADGNRYGLTYKWNAAGTDAELLPGGATETFDITDDQGQTRPLTWNYPSRSDCMQCHTPGRGDALGARTHQLNIDIPDLITGQPISQLTKLQPYLSGNLSILERAQSSRPLDDETAPVELRIRSYLDSNCSHCHSPEGGVGFFDARLTTPLTLQNLIDVMATGHNNTNPNARYIKPGDSSLSLIHSRLASTTPGIAMPPLGRETADPLAVSLISRYINDLNPSHFGPPRLPSGRYLRLTAFASPEQSSTSISELSIYSEGAVLIPKDQIQVVSVNDELNPGSIATILDGVTSGYWQTNPGVEGSFVLDLGQSYNLESLYIQRFFSVTSQLRIETSENGTTWQNVAERPWAGHNTEFRGFASRPIRVEIAGPKTSEDDRFTITAVFDENIPLLTADQIAVTGGHVISISGGGGAATGQQFKIAVQSTAPLTTVQIEHDAIRIGALSNRASNLWTFLGSALTYEKWAALHEVDPSPEYDLADDDGDGVHQIMEYAFGLDPRKSDGRPLDQLHPELGGLPLITRNPETGKLNMTVRIRKGGLPLRYTAEFTGDFLNYDRQIVTIPAGEEEWHEETITDVFSSGLEMKRFGRLAVERESN